MSFALLRLRRTWSFHVAVFHKTVKKCARIYNAGARLLFCSLKLLFGDVLVALVVVVCLRSLLITPLNRAKHGSGVFQLKPAAHSAASGLLNNLTVAKVDHQIKQSQPVSSLTEPILSIPTHTETDLTELEPPANTLSSMNDSALMGCWDSIICQGCVTNPASVFFITSQSL